MANYNESRIYKIYCTLSTINEFYIGSSTRYEERCMLHKSDCTNINSPRYSYKLYDYIRKNGGWENFTVEVLEKYPCKNRIELNIREEWWKQQEQPTLNTNKAHTTIEELKEQQQKYHQHYQRKVKQCDKCGKTYKHRANHQKSKYCKNYKSTTSESSTESFIESDTDVE